MILFFPLILLSLEVCAQILTEKKRKSDEREKRERETEGEKWEKEESILTALVRF